MRAMLVFLVMFTASAVANQVVWKWVDKDGVTHYTDRPVPGATRVELSVGSRADAPAASSPTRAPAPPPAGAGPPYRNFEIWKPGNDETVANTGGQVTVNIRLEPALAPGHSVNLYLDGRLVEGFPGNALTFDIKDVARGTHTLVAVITARGSRIQETSLTTFHVRQESAAQPPVGPSLRTPPKPRSSSNNKLPVSQPSYAALNGQRQSVNPATNLPQQPAKPLPATPKRGN